MSILMSSEIMIELHAQNGMLMADKQRMVKALELMLSADGEIHPGWNAEYLDAVWIRKLAEYGLGYSIENRGIKNGN